MNSLVISDPEGYDMITQSEYIKVDKNKVNLYVCGDIIDSTFIGNLKEPYLSAKSRNLSNIYNCITNDKIKLSFGNRDLNKIKCKFLTLLKEESQVKELTKMFESGKVDPSKQVINPEIISKFNKGEIDLSEDSYKKLKETVNKLDNPWKIESLNSWYPFWGGILVSKEKQNDWSISNYSDKSKVFLTRFNEIFGADTAVGTMSAQNLLHTIPIELGISTSDDDCKAFIVLAIFRSMLIGEYTKPTEPTKTLDIKTIKNSSQVRGWLVKLYSKHNAINFFEDDNNLYIMSHGGITSKIINNNVLEKLLTYLSNKENIDKYAVLKSAKLFYGLTGGYYKDKDIDIKSQEEIKKNIKSINETISKALEKSLSASTEDITEPTPEILLLLIITTEFDCKKFSDKSSTKIQSCDPFIKPTDYGPIMPGINNMRRLMFLCKEKILYQFIGHKPVGICADIDLFESGSSKGYLVTLDNSNTLTGTVNNNNVQSKSYADINNNNGEVNIKSYVKLSGFNKTEFNTQKFTDEIIINQTSLISSKDKEENIEFDINNSVNSLDEYIKKAKNKDENVTFCYHGYVDKNSIKYHVLTKQKEGDFGRNILILSEVDFNNYFTEEPKQPPSQAGGNFYMQSTQAYNYNKYLKYKQKYLEAKKLYGEQIHDKELVEDLQVDELEGGTWGDNTFIFCSLPVYGIMGQLFNSNLKFNDKDFFLFCMGPKSFYTEEKSKKLCRCWGGCIENFWEQGLGEKERALKNTYDSSVAALQIKSKMPNGVITFGNNEQILPILRGKTLTDYKYFTFKSVRGGYLINFPRMI